MLPTRVFKLRNGLTVVVQTDRSAPLVAVSMTYRVGSLDEKPGLGGFAHLFEHLMFQGTKNLPPNEISKLVETNGGVDNAYTMKTNTTYHEVVPSWALEAVLWAEADRMHGLLISPRELEIEKRVVLEEMGQSYGNQPYRRATDAVMGELAFTRWESSHPTIGDEKDLRAATLDDVRHFYDLHYVPDNAVLALVGDVSPAEARKLVARHFAKVKRRAPPKSPKLDEPKIRGERRRRVEDPLAKNPLLVAGWHAPKRGSDDYWAITALTAILGGGEDSPLHEELVKKTRLALSASAHMPYWSSHSSGRGPDLFGVFVSPRADADLAETLAAADRVLERFRKEGPTGEELARAKIQLERAWYDGQQSLVDRAQTLSSYVALVGDPAGFWRDFRRLMKVDRRAVTLAARRWTGSRGRAVLEVVPGAPVPAAPPPAASEPPAEEPRAPGAPPPPNGPAKSAVLPRLARFTLKNGLEVLHVRDARLPLVEARLGLRAGRAHEAAGEEALSPAVEELLLKGCDGQDAAAVARAFTGAGWSVGSSSEAEWFKLSGSGLARTFDAFAAQLARVLTRASYPEDEVEMWRENAVEELQMRRAQASFLGEERLRAELFPGHPYGRGAADEALIGAVSRERLRRYHAARLGPTGGHLVLVGDIAEGAAREALEKAFEPWAARAAPAAAPALPDHGSARTVLVDRPGSSQASLLVAHTAALTPHDPDYLAFIAANHVLGGTANSRMFENLRTRKGYTYGAYTSMEVYGRGTVWSAGADVRPDVAKAALEEIRFEAERLRAEPVPEDVLASSKRHLAGLFLMRLAALDRVASYLAAVVESGREPAEVMGSYQRRLAAVTPEAALAAARARLDPARFVNVVVGDAKVLRPILGL
ncbi:MAG TPA: pitrilysin family protein [Elusimicrobiota bacterium]|nr:pitrilysin family protein [Elusimicrobiota bacterium]